MDAIKAAPPLSIEIKNSKPIELRDLTLSFEGFADEFRRYVANTSPEAAADDVRLYIREIRSGSLIADVVAATPQIMQVVGYVNAVGGFAKYLKIAYDFLAGKSDEKPDFDKTSLENLTKIVEPIAKDRASQLNVGTNNGVIIQMTSAEANAAQNSARREIENLRDPGSRLHEKVVLYWYQARGDATTTVGDKGIIESITVRPVKVICANDRIKAQMVLDVVNPFREAFVVDVMVETIKEKPVLYNILAVHDIFERED